MTIWIWPHFLIVLAFQPFLYVVILYQRPKEHWYSREDSYLLKHIFLRKELLSISQVRGLLAMHLGVLIRYGIYLSISLWLCTLNYESVFLQVPKCRFPLLIHLKLLEVAFIFFYSYINEFILFILLC